jgi:hypothetical protein
MDYVKEALEIVKAQASVRAGAPGLPAPYNIIEELDALFAGLRKKIDEAKEAGLKIGWSWNDAYNCLNLHITHNRAVLINEKRVN